MRRQLLRWNELRVLCAAQCRGPDVQVLPGLLGGWAQVASYQVFRREVLRMLAEQSVEGLTLRHPREEARGRRIPEICPAVWLWWKRLAGAGAGSGLWAASEGGPRASGCLRSGVGTWMLTRLALRLTARAAARYPTDRLQRSVTKARDARHALAGKVGATDVFPPAQLITGIRLGLLPGSPIPSFCPRQA
jgi:hypothetical protein